MMTLSIIFDVAVKNKGTRSTADKWGQNGDIFPFVAVVYSGGYP